MSNPHFIYFPKGSPVLHRSHTNTHCMCNWCVNGEENTLKKRFEVQLNLKITDYSPTCNRWTDLSINHRHRITYRVYMASRMMNTDVIRFWTSTVWRLTWNKCRTSHPENGTNASVTSTWPIETATGIIRRASIILRGSIAYLRFHFNY